MAGGVRRDPAGRQNAHEAECRNGSQRRSTCTESTRPRTSRQFLIGRLRHVGAVNSSTHWCPPSRMAALAMLTS